MILKMRPKCYFCHAPSNPGEYCYGCGYNVCDNCDKLKPVGKHDVSAHQVAQSKFFPSGGLFMTAGVADLARQNPDFAQFVRDSLARYFGGDWAISTPRTRPPMTTP